MKNASIAQRLRCRFDNWMARLSLEQVQRLLPLGERP
jgi:hypothetical protein